MAKLLMKVYDQLGYRFFEGIFPDGRIRAYILPNNTVVEINLDRL